MRGSCISRPQLIRSQRGSRETAFASTGRLRAVETRTSGNGGRPYGKTAEKDNTPAPKDGPAPAGSGAIEERGAEFTCCAKFSRIVPPRDGRIHRLVPLRTSIVVQPKAVPSTLCATGLASKHRRALPGAREFPIGAPDRFRRPVQLRSVHSPTCDS